MPGMILLLIERHDRVLSIALPMLSSAALWVLLDPTKS